MTSPTASADLARLRRAFAIRIAVAGAVLCLAGAPLTGLAVLLTAAWLSAAGGGHAPPG